MIMKKIIFIILFFPLFSCNDWLEVESEVSVTYRNYFQNEQDIEQIFATMCGAEKKIYMVKNTDGEAGNLYSEYMVIDGKLEKVGDWKVDLSSYAKTTEVTAAIANALTAYAKTADVTKAINAAVAGLIQLDDLSVASTGAGNVVTGLAYDNKTGKFTVTKGLTALTEADFTEITQQEVKAMFA